MSQFTFDPLAERYEIEGWSRRTLGQVAQLVGIALLAVVALGDYLTDPEMSFGCFYLVPVLVVTWFSSPRAGAGIAVLSSMLWPVAYLFGFRNESTVWITCWNALARAAMLLAFVWLAATVNREQGRRPAAAKPTAP